VAQVGSVEGNLLWAGVRTEEGLEDGVGSGHVPLEALSGKEETFRLRLGEGGGEAIRRCGYFGKAGVPAVTDTENRCVLGRRRNQLGFMKDDGQCDVVSRCSATK
jgi:hypothetical protein